MSKPIDTLLVEIEKLIHLAMADVAQPDVLNNKLIEICILPFSKSLYIHFVENQVYLLLENTETPHTKITGYPSHFIQLLLNPKKDIPSEINLEGDLNTLMALNHFMQTLQIDWEEILSQIIGDIPAYLASQSLQRFKSWLNQNHDTFKQNTFEYCVDELQITPSPIELKTYYDAVDDLRDRTERLLKKFKKNNKMNLPC